MAMTVGRNEGVMVEMNTTPLIDVMLVLLTLLIITLPIQSHAVKLDMPASAPAQPVETVNLGVDFDGSLTWDGRPVDRRLMDSYLADAASRNPQPQIQISANRLAKYDAVAKVLADAQRLKATHIGFQGIDQYN